MPRPLLASPGPLRERRHKSTPASSECCQRCVSSHHCWEAVLSLPVEAVLTMAVAFPVVEVAILVAEAVLRWLHPKTPAQTDCCCSRWRH